MGRLSEEVAAHRAALEALRGELTRASSALLVAAPSSSDASTLSETSACLRGAAEAAEVLVAASSKETQGTSDTVSQRLLEAAASLSGLQAGHEKLRAALAVAARDPKDLSSAAHGDGQEKRPKSRDGRGKAKTKAPVDFSAFTRARWEAERLKGASMLGLTDDSADPGTGSSGVKVWMNEMPRPVQEEKPCTQVKGRHIMVNSAEKVRKVYVEVSVSGNPDKIGFVRGANLARFSSLATERSDCPSAKKGGDMGWISKSKGESKFNEVAFVTPKGACSPPFKSQNGFHMFLCEDRKG